MARSDRPLSRKLIRLGFQALGRNRAHRQDLWPGMAIDRRAGHVDWRGRRLLSLVPPDRIFRPGLDLIAVVGSGPSLRDQRVAALGDGAAILCNGAAQLCDRIRPLAVAVEDERFVFRHHAMLSGLPPEIPVLLSPAALRAWAEREAGTLRGRPVTLIENLVKPVGAQRRDLSDPALKGMVVTGPDAAMSLDPATGVVITGTVAFSALQFALAARPRRILLAGIDLSNDSAPRFYETAGDRAPSGLTAGMDRILAGFALARTEAEGRGVEIACASPVSALLGLGYPLDRRLEHPS